MLDAGYCDRRRDVVWYVCLLITTIGPAKMAEMPLERQTRDGSKNHVLERCTQWRHLANTTIGDAGITVVTCYINKQQQPSPA